MKAVKNKSSVIGKPVKTLGFFFGGHESPCLPNFPYFYKWIRVFKCQKLFAYYLGLDKWSVKITYL